MQPHPRPWQPVGGVRSVDHTSRGATYNISVWEDVGQVYTYSLSGSPRKGKGKGGRVEGRDVPVDVVGSVL